MPRPNARSMLSFQRRVSFISGPVERRFLKSRLERAARHVPARADARPDQRDQHGQTTIAGRRRGTSRARPRPSRAGERPPASPRASSAASAAGNTRNVATQQNRIPTPPISPKWRKPRKSVASSDAYETDAVSAAASVPPRLPWTAAPSAATGSSVAAALLEVAREQDDPEVDAVADDDRRQERRRQVQVADAEAGERERRQRAQRQRAQQRADGRRSTRRTAACRSRRSRP